MLQAGVASDTDASVAELLIGDSHATINVNSVDLYPAQPYFHNLDSEDSGTVASRNSSAAS